MHLPEIHRQPRTNRSGSVAANFSLIGMICASVLVAGCMASTSLPINYAESEVLSTRWLGVPDPAFGIHDAGDDVRTTCGEYHGTAKNPVIVQVDFDGRCNISGSYIIVENSRMERIFIDGHFIVLRNSHISGANAGSMVWVAHESSDVVIYNNEIDHNGTIPSKKDRHGIGLGHNTDRVWILDNHIHHNSGDGIQFCHVCVRRGNGPRAVYISGNEIHDDEENAIDLKEFVGPVVITNNTMYGYRRGKFSGNGEALRINDEGKQGQLWVVANSFRDNRIDINPSRSRAESYLLDNGNAYITQGAWVVTSGKQADRYYRAYEQAYGVRMRPNDFKGQ